MAYANLADFAAGIDLRKSRVTAKAGGLRQLQNAFVNAGGEIEKRKKLAILQVLPGGTFGLAGINNQLYVFGLIAPGGITITPPVFYQQLIPSPPVGGGVTIDRILDADVFANIIYTVARFTDGSVKHFYGSTEVAGQGTTARTFRTKMYAASGANVRFSAVNDPADWSGTGSGLIDVTAQDVGSADIIGLENYYNYLALLGRRSIQIWAMASDPAQNQYVQTLGNTGLIAPNAASRYGNGDVLFLSDTGIRSIRARDSSNAAVLNDIGSPIDSLVIGRRLNMSQTDAERIRALVDPLSGHFWMIWGQTVYALAYYPATKVTAWSTYDLGFVADYAAVAGNRLALRSGNTIYLYGDASDPVTALENYTPNLTAEAEYDDALVTVETPMLDFDKPATHKNFMGFDVAAEGVWTLEVCPDPTNPTVYDVVAVVDQPTYSLARIPYQASTTHLAIRMTCQSPGFARLGAVSVHYEPGDAE